MRRNVLAVFIIIGLFLLSFILVQGKNFLETPGTFRPANDTVIQGNDSFFFNVSLFTVAGWDTPLVASNHTGATNATWWLSNTSGSVLLITTYNISFNQSIWNTTISFANSSTARLSEGNYSFTVNITNHSLQMVNFSSIPSNITIDRLKPNLTATNINITDGLRTLTGSGFPGLNGTDYLTNVTLTVRGTVEDSSGQVLIVYNITNRPVNLTQRNSRVDPAVHSTNVSQLFGIGSGGEGISRANYISQSSGTGPSVWNGTIPALPHGTNISFGVWANDSVAGLGGTNNLELRLQSQYAINNSRGFNLTVDGIRPIAKITISEGGTVLDDSDAVTRGVTVKVECQDESSDKLPAHSFNVTVDRPGSEGDSGQQTNARDAANSVQVLNFNTAGDGEPNGEFTARCNIQDVGGSSSTTRKFVVQSAGGSGGGSSGGSSGGGAGAPGTPSTTEKVVEYASINADTLKSIQNFGAGAGIQKLMFELSAAVTNAKVEVTTSSSKPSEVSTTPVSKVARYITITTTNIPSDKIKKATMEFAVDKSWLTTNSIDSGDVSLYRFNNGKWEEYKATKLSISTTKDYKYSAAIPRFSVFAIGVASSKSTPGTGEEAGEGTTPGEEAGKPSSAGMVVLWIVIIAAVLVGVWFYITKKKKAPKK